MHFYWKDLSRLPALVFFATHTIELIQTLQLHTHMKITAVDHWQRQEVLFVSYSPEGLGDRIPQWVQG